MKTRGRPHTVTGVRGEHGQTAAELLGGLLVVSVIIAALATTDAGAAISREAERLVCEIAGGGCQEPAPGTPPLEPFEFDGPPLAGRTLPILPFPGSVTVTCSADKRQPETCVPKGQPGVSVQAGGEIKVERTPSALDYNGCPLESMSIQGTLKFVANAEAKGAKIGGQIQAHVGQATKYSITVTPATAEDIEQGRRQPPNPVDPRSLARNESIQLNEDYFAGIKAKGTYKQLQLELGYDAGRRVSSGVRRIDNSKVRVMVGDEDFVKHALKFGAKLGDASVSLGNTKELSDGKLHAVDIDISTTAGWDAYQQFIATGRLPEPGSPGTYDPTKAETVVYKDTTELEAKFGGIAIGGPMNSSEGRWIQSRNLATGETQTITHVRYNQTSFAVVDGKDPRYSLMLHDVHPSYIEGLYERTGQKLPAGPLQKDVRFDFTPSQLEELQQIALEQLADKVALNGDGRPSTEEIARSLRENHGIVEYKHARYDFGGLESALGGAATPEEMLIALYRTGFLSPNRTIEEISGLLMGKQLELPATIHVPEC
jgi:hypothetical protein